MARPPIRTFAINATKGVVYETVDYRGTQDIPTRPQRLQCDYCCQPSDRLWLYRCPPFGVEMWRGRHMVCPDPTMWGGCVYCNALVIARDAETLAARVCTLNVDFQGAPVSGYIRLYEGVFQALYGDPVLWTSGQERPTGVAM